MTTANDDLLFIERVRSEGLVSEEQLAETLDIQEQVAEMGVPDGIGSLMVKRGLLSAEKAEEIYERIGPSKRRQQIEGYRLMRRLGHGGMAYVYLARQETMDRLVALKILKTALAGDPKQLERLRREAQVVGRLTHPNIVRGLDFGESNGFTYFAMEYIEGSTIRDHLKNGRRFSERDALRIVREVTEALGHAWSEGVTHRDVKPGNVMIRPDGRAMLMDYGLAKAPIDGELTQTGTALGTPQYIAPEQARNPRDADIRSDLYSLGATLYHMVTGRAPYDGETLGEIYTKVLLRPHDPPQAHNPKLSRDIAFLIDKLMAKDPRQRHQTPRELLRDLDRMAAGRPLAPAGWEGDWNAYVLRRAYQRKVLLIGAAVVVAFGALAGFLYDRSAQAEEAENRRAADAQRFAAGREEAAAFEDIPQVAELWAEVAREHGDRLSGAHAAAERWARIAAAHRRVEEGLALANGRPESDHAARIAILRELRDAGDVHSLVGAALDERLASEIERAEIAARDRLLRIDLAPHLPIAMRRKALDELAAALDERWPGDVATSVREHVDRQRRSLEQIQGVMTALEGEVRAHVETYAGDDVTGPGRFLDLDAAVQSSVRSAEEAARETGALVGVPEPAAEEFGRFLRGIERTAATRDPTATRALLREVDQAIRVERANEPPVFATWIDRLETRAEGALAASRDELRRMATQLREEVSRRTGEAREAFSPEAERLRSLLGQRKYVGASDLLTEFEARLGEWGGLLAPWIGDDLARRWSELRRCRDVFGRARAAVAARIGESGEFRRRGGIGVPGTIREVAGVIPEATVRIETAHGDQTLRLVDLATANVLDWAGLGREPKGDDRVLAGLFRLIEEPRDEQDLRRDRKRLESIHELVSSDPVYRNELIERIDRTVGEQVAREAAAASLLAEGERFREGAKAQETFVCFADLLARPEYRNTDFVDGRLATIERYRELARLEIESKETGRERFSGGVGYQILEGTSGGHSRRARLTIDFDHARLLDNFSIAAGRAAVVNFIRQSPVLAAALREGDAADDTVAIASGVLELRSGPTEPERLQHHPLILESPFRHGDPITFECDVSSPKPVFFGVSLAGACVGIVSQDDIVEGGRGVAFWTGKGLRDVDRQSVFEPLRAASVRRTIESTTDADERRRLEETTYFRMRPGRWYRIRFEKGTRDAALFVDGREIGRWELDGGSLADRSNISILVYTKTRIDDLVIEGTVDPKWEAKRR